MARVAPNLSSIAFDLDFEKVGSKAQAFTGSIYHIVLLMGPRDPCDLQFVSTVSAPVTLFPQRSAVLPLFAQRRGTGDHVRVRSLDIAVIWGKPNLFKCIVLSGALGPRPQSLSFCIRLPTLWACHS